MNITCDPEELEKMTDEELIKRGYDVTVVTAIPKYPQGKFYDGYGLNKKRTENYKGMKIIYRLTVTNSLSAWEVFQTSLNRS